MMLVNYASKKAMKECIGQPLNYQETSAFGPEFKENGSFSVAYRPYYWAHPNGKREFFARVTMENGLIAKVE